MKKIKLLISSVMLIIFNGCVSSAYQEFYEPLYTVKQIQESTFSFLPEGSEPEIITISKSNNVDKKIKELQAHGLEMIGYSSFNGSYESTNHAVALGKELRAVLILLNSQYSNTVTRTSYYTVKEKETTNSSANVNTRASYTSNSGYNAYGNANTNYSGTTTTYKTKAIPYTYSTKRYDQGAYFFIRSNYKYKFGTMGSTEISREQRINIGQSGILINNIRAGTPVYNSNILIGDILIKFDGINVKNHKHYSELCANFDISKKYSIWTVIRNNKKIDVKINF